MTPTGGTFADLHGALTRPWLWGRLAWQDVKRRYAGSLIGSLWIVANASLTIAALSFIFVRPFGGMSNGYIPYVAVGLVLWQFIQTSLNEAGQVFVAASDTVRNAPLPLALQPLRVVTRNLIILAHNAVVAGIVLGLSGVTPVARIWQVFPALILFILTACSVTLLLGVIGARFRDVPQLVTNVTQILFFVTPVFWPPEILGPDRAWLVAANPVHAAIDIIRAPLVGMEPHAASWPVAAATAALLTLFALLAFRASRGKIALWV